MDSKEDVKLLLVYPFKVVMDQECIRETGIDSQKHTKKALAEARERTPDSLHALLPMLYITLPNNPKEASTPLLFQNTCTVPNFTRTSYLHQWLDPSAPPFFRRLADSETERSEGREK